MKTKLFLIAGLFLSFLILPGSVFAGSWCYTFNKNLGTADSGSLDVAYLHVALLTEGISYGNDGLTAYSDGTIAGVIAFQEKYTYEILSPWGLTHGTGYVGNTTRQKLNQLYGCSGNSGNPVNPVNPTCTPSWNCTSWTSCYNNQQNRTCTDYNFCGTTSGRPVTTQSCTSNSSCTENWQCTSWSSCSNGQQTKICTDYNFCGTTNNKPATTQSCTSNSNNTNNTNTCQATCITQTDGIYAIDCDGDTTKCSANQTCEQTFDTDYNYSSGYVQTVQTLTGARCTYSSTNNNNNNTCTPDWDCGDWSACVNSQQTRTCTDSNDCGTTTGKPVTTQSCCNTNWSCGTWSACANKNQIRTCSDLNNCGTTTGKPATSQSCCAPDWHCSSWSTCSSNGNQTRTCSDSNSCGTIAGKPITSQSCVCVERWQCGAWSICTGGWQNRMCWDNNNCITQKDKPSIRQECTSTCSPNWVCDAWLECGYNRQQQRICRDSKQCFDVYQEIESRSCTPE